MLIEVQNFCKAYGDYVAVDGISFSVKPGQILGLVGPNGAGKTTTLRALTGIIPSSRGRLSVNGFDIDRDAIQAKRITGYVPDDPQLFHDLSVQQHLEFTASVYGVRDAEPKAESLLETFELVDKRNTSAADLSRGMRQKLAICCAYLPSPQGILLDEPMTGLDPRGIRVFKESVIMRAREGAAVIISSHLLAMVEDICTDVMILDHGRQTYCGPLDGLRVHLGEDDHATTLEELFLSATGQVEPVEVA